MHLRKLIILIFGIYLSVTFVSSFAYYIAKKEMETVKVLNGIPDTILNYIIFPVKYIFNLSKVNSGLYIRDEVSFDGINHVSNNSTDFTNSYFLTSYPTKNQFFIELIEISSGKIIKQWRPNLDSINKLTRLGKNRLSKLHSVNSLVHPILLKDSSIIASTGYSLVKINKSSIIEWVSKEYESHHSIEFSDDGNLWITGRKIQTSLSDVIIKDNENFYDDLIMKINPKNGKVIFEKSLLQILKDNEIYDLVYKNGSYEKDPIHLNDVQPAYKKSEFWEKGDLLLSSRHLSSIFIYRPSSNKIIWRKQGPWINQHDPDFINSNEISVFGNQFIRGDMQNNIIQPEKFNKIFIYNFKTDSIYEPYKKFLESEKISTNTGGRSEILPNGDLFIEESDKGRVFIGDTIKKKVSFTKRVDEHYISHLNWTRILIN